VFVGTKTLPTVTNYPVSQLVDVSCSGEHFNQDQLHFGVIVVLYQVDLLIQSGKHTVFWWVTTQSPLSTGCGSAHNITLITCFSIHSYYLCFINWI